MNTASGIVFSVGDRPVCRLTFSTCTNPTATEFAQFRLQKNTHFLTICTIYMEAYVQTWVRTDVPWQKSLVYGKNLQR
jgi:hypothetical protein